MNFYITEFEHRTPRKIIYLRPFCNAGPRENVVRLVKTFTPSCDFEFWFTKSIVFCKLVELPSINEIVNSTFWSLLLNFCQVLRKRSKDSCRFPFMGTTKWILFTAGFIWFNVANWRSFSSRISGRASVGIVNNWRSEWSISRDILCFETTFIRYLQLQFKSMRSATCALSCRIRSFNACTLNQVCKIKVRYWYSFNIILRTFNQLFCSSREDINEIVWPWGLHWAYKWLSEQCPYSRKKCLFKLYDSYNMSPGSWTLRLSSFWLNE